MLIYAQNPLHTLPHNLPVDEEVANLLAASRCNGIWEMTRQQPDTTDFCPCANLLQTCCGLLIYVVDLFQGSRQLVTDLLRGNWCNGFWPIARFGK